MNRKKNIKAAANNNNNEKKYENYINVCVHTNEANKQRSQAWIMSNLPSNDIFFCECACVLVMAAFIWWWYGDPSAFD